MLVSVGSGGSVSGTGEATMGVEESTVSGRNGVRDGVPAEARDVTDAAGTPVPTAWAQAVKTASRIEVWKRRRNMPNL